MAGDAIKTGTPKLLHAMISSEVEPHPPANSRPLYKSGDCLRGAQIDPAASMIGKAFCSIFDYLLYLSAVVTGPVAFAACMQGLGLYVGGVGTALTACSATACFPPAYITRVGGICGLGGGALLASCIAALMAPTP